MVMSIVACFLNMANLNLLVSFFQQYFFLYERHALNRVLKMLIDDGIHRYVTDLTA
jgi:hypothetical protein